MPICEYCDTLGATHHIFERATYEWKQSLSRVLQESDV